MLCAGAGALVASAHFGAFDEFAIIVKDETRVNRKFVQHVFPAHFFVVAGKNPGKGEVAASRSGRVVQVTQQRSLNISREYSISNEWAEASSELAFPFSTVRFRAVAVFFPCFQMGQFVHQGNKECIRIEGAVYSDG